jgi:hypothetical protein
MIASGMRVVLTTTEQTGTVRSVYDHAHVAPGYVIDREEAEVRFDDGHTSRVSITDLAEDYI